MPQLSNFCRKCGGKITMRQPPNENEVRHVCEACGFIDYYNPKLVRSVFECLLRSLLMQAIRTVLHTCLPSHERSRSHCLMLTCSVQPGHAVHAQSSFCEARESEAPLFACVQVVGCIVEHEGKVLLCRRAIQPCKGLWTVPAGFLEMGESTAAGAARETWEEANARVEVRTTPEMSAFRCMVHYEADSPNSCG